MKNSQCHFHAKVVTVPFNRHLMILYLVKYLCHILLHYLLNYKGENAIKKAQKKSFWVLLVCWKVCTRGLWSQNFTHSVQEIAQFCSSIVVVMGNISQGLIRRSWTGEIERESWWGITEREKGRISDNSELLRKTDEEKKKLENKMERK